MWFAFEHAPSTDAGCHITGFVRDFLATTPQQAPPITPKQQNKFNAATSACAKRTQSQRTTPCSIPGPPERTDGRHHIGSNSVSMPPDATRTPQSGPREGLDGGKSESTNVSPVRDAQSTMRSYTSRAALSSARDVGTGSACSRGEDFGRAERDDGRDPPVEPLLDLMQATEVSCGTKGSQGQTADTQIRRHDGRSRCRADRR